MEFRKVEAGVLVWAAAQVGVRVNVSGRGPGTLIRARITPVGRPKDPDARWHRWSVRYATTGHGRRSVGACWHAHRDFLRAVFAHAPAATVRTRFARYTAEGFEQQFPPTGDVNIGSQYYPVTMPDCCGCDE